MADNSLDFFGLDLAAIAFNSDPEYNQPRTDSTAVTNAIGAMEPNATPGFGGGEWGGFWDAAGAALKNVAAYSIAKDAQRTGTVPQSTATSTTMQPGQNTTQVQQRAGLVITPNMLMLGAFAALMFVAMRK